MCVVERIEDRARRREALEDKLPRRHLRDRSAGVLPVRPVPALPRLLPRARQRRAPLGLLRAAPAAGLLPPLGDALSRVPLIISMRAGGAAPCPSSSYSIHHLPHLHAHRRPRAKAAREARPFNT